MRPIEKILPLADEFGQIDGAGYGLAVLVEMADCVVQVDYEVLCAELIRIKMNQKVILKMLYHLVAA